MIQNIKRSRLKIKLKEGKKIKPKKISSKVIHINNQGEYRAMMLLFQAAQYHQQLLRNTNPNDPDGIDHYSSILNLLNQFEKIDVETLPE